MSALTPLRDRTAFELAGRSPACLLLHGFVGDPREMRPFAEAINTNLGLYVYAPLWPGHGLPPQALHGLHTDDFLKAGNDALDHIRERHSTVFVIAFSMGGALASILIAQRPTAGFIALAPMFAIRNPLLPLVSAAQHIIPWVYPLRFATSNNPMLREAMLA